MRPTKPPRKPAKKRELRDWIERSGPSLIGEAEWDLLLRDLAPLSGSYLRRLLRDFSGESGVPLTPLVEGVRQESLESLESSLLRLLAEYEPGDAARRLRVRKVVIEAKDHARLAARSGGPEAGASGSQGRDEILVDADVARKSRLFFPIGSGCGGPG